MSEIGRDRGAERALALRLGGGTLLHVRGSMTEAQDGLSCVRVSRVRYTLCAMRYALIGCANALS
eukprot:scaffold19194_cov38-Tisochrysis_lutea.AAC.1